jgi:arylsulfatase A-like enzyme
MKADQAYVGTTDRTARAMRKRFWLLIFGLSIFIVGGVWGWHGIDESTADEAPNVLLISIDTLRADRLGCYDWQPAQTPNLDRLAEQGALFESVSTTSPITLPAHASILTGQYPTRHGVRDNDTHRLPDDVTTLTEVLKRRGYQTAAFIGGIPLKRVGGLDQGFDHYDDAITSNSTASNGSRSLRLERYAQEVVDAASKWLKDADPTRPIFGFLHFYDPHAPYELSLAGAGQASYDGEIAYVDRVLGELLSALSADPKWRDSLIVITSDHGESLGEHDELTHCIFTYEATLHVPLIIHRPGQIRPMRIAAPASVTDIMPTMLELLGAPAVKGLDGRSLAGALRGEPLPDRAQYFESLYGALRMGWAPLRGIRLGTMKYIDAPRPEVYDLSVDRGELNNLIATHGDFANRARSTLREIGEGQSAGYATDSARGEALSALGYFDASPVGADSVARMDPKDGIALYTQFHEAFAAMRGKELDRAEEILAGLESSFARSPYYYYERGNLAMELDQLDRCEVYYKKAISLQPSYLSARRNLGVLYLRSNRPELARNEFETIIEMDPNHVDAHLYAGVVAQKHIPDMRKLIFHWKRFVELAPEHPEAAKIRRALTAGGA